MTLPYGKGAAKAYRAFLKTVYASQWQRTPDETARLIRKWQERINATAGLPPGTTVYHQTRGR